ncbi:ABC transporter permease [Nocardioides immobilis]|uniref:ABC transporter permease n=1 Tax=Nocardioides immobilis TaxID=2049295 RepID=A0A417XS30_9ACTN|nr:ABC transporter permease [Nocardioides immobilis]RHW22736.1 ABC transporter permease [Nocardioides immobilis]
MTPASTPDATQQGPVVAESVDTPTQTNSAGTEASEGKRNLGKFIEDNGSVWTAGVLLVIVVGFAVSTPNFFTQQGWQAVSVSATLILLLAIGQTFVIVSGGIDLSVGGVLGFAGMMSALVMSKLLTSGMSQTTIMLIGLVVALTVGMVVGAVNGLISTRFSLIPFIVTLGTLGICQGGTQLANGGQEISNIPLDLLIWGNKVILDGWLAVPVAVTAGVAAIAWISLSKTRFGRRTHAIGSNAQAAQRTGINVSRHLVVVYMVSGLFAGLAGFIAMAQLGVATVTAGQNTELAAIAAVVIGGTSLVGGRGSVAGTVLGALIVAVLETGLVIARVNSAWQLIAVGAILIGALLADQQRLRAARTAR